MAPLKAPRPNGMSLLSYQTFWNLLGDDVSQSALYFLNSATFPAHLNDTFITLIPKVNSLKLMSKFRPINFYNVLYKISLKVLANRLKRFYQKLSPSTRVYSLRVDIFLIIFW